MSEDTLNINPPEIKKKRGGKREGAGRKVGSITKVHTKSIMHAIEAELGVDWETQFARNYAAVVHSGDVNMIAKYDHMMYHKHTPDKVDHTSNGETLKAAFSFVPQELSDWKDEKK